MTNKELISIANMELRDQLEAERQVRKALKVFLNKLEMKADTALIAIQNDNKSDVFSIFKYSEVQEFYGLINSIRKAIQ